MATQHHLADEDFAVLLAGGAPRAAQRHLDACSACRQERERLEQDLAGMRASVAGLAQQPEAFWTRQRAALLARARQRRLAALSAPLLATACLLLAMALGLLSAQPTPAPQAVASPPADMLVEVERTLQQPVPDALAPAALLTDEIMAQTSSPRPQKPNKEKGNEI
jgi:predicted anti-sigma-YlaC factor YlaD